MFKFKVIAFLLMAKASVSNIYFEPKHAGFERNKREFKITSLGRISFLESSGLEVTGEGGQKALTHTDSGGRPELYTIDLNTGYVLDTLGISGAANRDWEDIARDTLGNIYIGDFGNNGNRRKDLRVFKYNKFSGQVGVIKFNYGDQTGFPPNKVEMNFDCEALVWRMGKLHLFSKNRGKKYVKHYVMPDQPGTYTIRPVEDILLKRMVTGADISPDGKKMALLGYGRVYLFNIDMVGQDDLFGAPYKSLSFSRGAQCEGIFFLNNQDLVISNETGRLFKITTRAK